MKIKITRDTFHDGQFAAKGTVLDGKPSDFIILLALGKATEFLNEPELEPEPKVKSKK